MTFPRVELPFLPPNTIVPVKDLDDTFVQYFMRLYEEIAFNINARDYTFFPIAISPTAANIPNLPNFGAFFIAVSGVESGQPAGTWALAKADANAAGLGLAGITLQAGTIAPWVGINLVITSPAPFTNFQIAHTGTVPGNFNIRIVGTQ